MKIIKEYANSNNGGKERVINDNGIFFINSFVGGEWLGARSVTRNQIESCMIYTGAPEDIKQSILAD